MKKVGVGIAGCGVIAHYHMLSLGHIQQCQPVAVFDVNPEAAARTANEYGIAAYSDLQAFLAHPGLDLVDICTPSGCRLDIIEAAAHAHKHVIVEKPLEVTVQRCQQAVDTCRQMGVKLGCILQNRYYPDILRVKRLIDAGRFGELMLIDASVNWYRDDDYYAKSAWRGTWKMDGGGALMNQGIHTVDLLRYFAGEVTGVSAKAQTRLHNIETEDNAAALLWFENGTLGTLTASTCAYPGVPVSISIHGSKGSAIFSGETLIYLHTADGEHYENYAALGGSTSGGSSATDMDEEGHTYVLGDMVHAILEDRQPGITGEDGLKTVALVESIYKSADVR
nr:Gfo/Idh/MocA family oxidoreductase [bacterium]